MAKSKSKVKAKAKIVKCKGVTVQGARCKKNAVAGKTTCYLHVEQSKAKSSSPAKTKGSKVAVKKTSIKHLKMDEDRNWIVPEKYNYLLIKNSYVDRLFEQRGNIGVVHEDIPFLGYAKKLGAKLIFVKFYVIDKNYKVTDDTTSSKDITKKEERLVNLMIKSDIKNKAFALFRLAKKSNINLRDLEESIDFCAHPNIMSTDIIKNGNDVILSVDVDGESG